MASASAHRTPRERRRRVGAVWHCAMSARRHATVPAGLQPSDFIDAVRGTLLAPIRLVFQEDD